MKLPAAVQRFVEARRTQDPKLRDALVSSGLVLTATVLPLADHALPADRIETSPYGAPTTLVRPVSADRGSALAPHQIRAQPEIPRSAAKKSLAVITSALDHVAAKLTKAEIHARLVDKYTTLGLLDAHGDWTVPALIPHAEELLPDDLDGPAMSAFVEQMGKAASRNPYLMRFLDAASRSDISKFRDKFVAEGDSALPDVLIHAQMLDRLTHVLSSDYRVSEACRDHWKTFESNPKFWDQLNVFEKAKLVSVNLGIDKYNATHRSGEVDPKTLAGILPLNIMEAWTADQYWAVTGPPEGRGGHVDNAFAAWVLATHGPQGEGPATLSPDGKMIELHQKATKAWDDLYATWNMGFVFGVSGDLKYLAKLVIPEVNDYADKPGEYINKRAIALHLTMINNAMEGVAGGRSYVSWWDHDLAALWGKMNAESAKAYSALADQHRP